MVRHLNFVLSDLGNCTILGIGNRIEFSFKGLL